MAIIKKLCRNAAFFLTVGFSFLSCKKDPSEPAAPVVVVDYMRLNSLASNQLEVTSVGTGEYELTTIATPI
jgi:hypothetical protein